MIRVLKNITDDAITNGYYTYSSLPEKMNPLCCSSLALV